MLPYKWKFPYQCRQFLACSSWRKKLRCRIRLQRTTMVILFHQDNEEGLEEERPVWGGLQKVVAFLLDRSGRRQKIAEGHHFRVHVQVSGLHLCSVQDLEPSMSSLWWEGSILCNTREEGQLWVPNPLWTRVAERGYKGSQQRAAQNYLGTSKWSWCLHQCCPEEQEDGPLRLPHQLDQILPERRQLVHLLPVHVEPCQATTRTSTSWKVIVRICCLWWHLWWSSRWREVVFHHSNQQEVLPDRWWAKALLDMQAQKAHHLKWCSCVQLQDLNLIHWQGTASLTARSASGHLLIAFMLRGCLLIALLGQWRRSQSK